MRDFPQKLPPILADFEPGGAITTILRTKEGYFSCNRY